MDDRGDFIITFSGKRFYPLDPQPEDINIVDIAHSLALINRYTGHTRVPYSVAQHCVLGSYKAEGHELAFLLHDASEAYVNDIARPVKQYLPDYQMVEDRIQVAIGKRFGVDLFHPVVYEVDTRMLVTEAPALLNGEGWWGDSKYPQPYDMNINPWDWEFAEEAYNFRFWELTH